MSICKEFSAVVSMRRRTGFDNIIVFLQFEVFEQYVGLEAEVAFFMLLLINCEC